MYPVKYQMNDLPKQVWGHPLRRGVLVDGPAVGSGVGVNWVVLDATLCSGLRVEGLAFSIWYSRTFGPGRCNYGSSTGWESRSASVRSPESLAPAGLTIRTCRTGRWIERCEKGADADFTCHEPFKVPIKAALL